MELSGVVTRTGVWLVPRQSCDLSWPGSIPGASTRQLGFFEDDELSDVAQFAWFELQFCDGFLGLHSKFF
jgi:hypothetical protein